MNTSEKTPEGFRPRILLWSLETFQTLQMKKKSILKIEIICMVLAFQKKFLKFEKEIAIKCHFFKLSNGAMVHQ